MNLMATKSIIFNNSECRCRTPPRELRDELAPLPRTKSLTTPPSHARSPNGNSCAIDHNNSTRAGSRSKRRCNDSCGSFVAADRRAGRASRERSSPRSRGTSGGTKEDDSRNRAGELTPRRIAPAMRQ